MRGRIKAQMKAQRPLNSMNRGIWNDAHETDKTDLINGSDLLTFDLGRLGKAAVFRGDLDFKRMNLSAAVGDREDRHCRGTLIGDVVGNDQSRPGLVDLGTNSGVEIDQPDVSSMDHCHSFPPPS